MLRWTDNGVGRHFIKYAKVDTFQLHLRNFMMEFVKTDTKNTTVDTLLSSLKPKHRPL